jgi:hypothetical protein
VGSSGNTVKFANVTITGSTDEDGGATTIFDGTSGAVTITGTIVQAASGTAVVTTTNATISLANTDTVANGSNLAFALGQTGIKS